MGYDNEYAMNPIGRPWMAFDIETCPMPDCQQYLTDPIEAPSNYKDPAKIAAYIAEKKAKQVEEAGLDLDLCEIVAIAVGFADRAFVQTRETTTEAEMLDGFWRFVRSMQKDYGVLVGFNCLHFDLPVLLRRSMYLGVPAPVVQIDKYRHDGVIDVAHELTFGGRMTWRSLAFYCKRFGIPYDDSVNGEQIAKMVADGKWADIAGHCEADVAVTAALARRVGLIAMPQPERESPESLIGAVA